MAAYGFDDYMDDGTGVTWFKREGQPDVALMGPEADNLKRELDRTRYEGATAENTFGVAPVGAERAGVFPQASSDRSAIDAQLAQAGVTPVRTDVARSLPTQQDIGLSQAPRPQVSQPQPGAPATTPSVPGAPQAAPQGMTRDQMRYIAQNTGGRYVGGQPEISERTIAQQLEMPRATNESVVRQGAEDTPERQAEREQAHIQSQKAQLLQTQTALNAENERGVMLAERATQAAQEEEDFRQRQQEVARKVQDAQKVVDDTDRAFTEQKLDPQRLFHEKGAWASVAAAIATGLGAYASILGGGPNQAQQIIDSAINRDIESQKAEMAKAKDRKMTALEQYNRLLGDQDLAEEALRLSMKRAAGAQMDAFNSKVAAGAMMPNYLAWKAEADKQYVAQKQAYADQAAGTYTRQVQSQMVSPQRATRGTRVGPSLKEQAANMGYLEEIYGAGGYDEPLTPEQVDKQARERGEIITNNRTAGNLLDEITRMAGGKPNKDGTNEWSDQDIPGIGVIDRMRDWTDSGKGREMKMKLRELAKVLAIRNNPGGRVSDADVQIELDGLTKLKTEAELRAKLDLEKRRQVAAERGVDGRYRPEVIQESDRRLGREVRKTLAPAPKDREELP